MTDEEFLKLAQECNCDSYNGLTVFNKNDFLTLCREVERRALGGVATIPKEIQAKWLEQGWMLESSARSMGDEIEEAIRAMIKEMK